jgi:hypothetical protein
VKRLDWATGEEIPQPSYVARRFPFQAWMPLEHGIESKDDYHRDLGPMIEAIRCCEKTPNAIGCRFRPIGPTEADVKLDVGLWSGGPRVGRLRAGLRSAHVVHTDRGGRDPRCGLNDGRNRENESVGTGGR